MKAYAYDVDGILVGETKMQLDPLESQKLRKKVYLTPSNATTTPPPKLAKGERARWTGTVWVAEPVPVPKDPDHKPEKPTRDPKEIERAYKLRDTRQRLRAAKGKTLSHEELNVLFDDVVTLLLADDHGA